MQDRYNPDKAAAVAPRGNAAGAQVIAVDSIKVWGAEDYDKNCGVFTVYRGSCPTSGCSAKFIDGHLVRGSCKKGN